MTDERGRDRRRASQHEGTGHFDEFCDDDKQVNRAKHYSLLTVSSIKQLLS